MRRARLKVQATVPIRRKVQQENAKAEEKPPVPNSAEDAEKSTENIVTNAEKPPENCVINAEKLSENGIDSVKKVPENCVESTGKLPESSIKTTEITPVKSENENKQCFPMRKQKATETEKLTDSILCIEKEPIKKSTLPIISEKDEIQNIEQEIPEIIREEKNVVNKEKNDSLASENSKNCEATDKTTDLQTDINTNKQVDIENSKNDNANKTSSEKDTEEVPHVEINAPKHASNRSGFMRPVPRLDSGGRVRKNSVQGSGASASESEDDGKKSSAPSRVRNDSICSVQSNKEGCNSNNFSKLKLGQQKRRLTVSESAKKLADARKEFMLKHENKTPDRSKLTMYDLIYYNPISNPMTRSENSSARKMSVCSNAVEETQENEEEEDEPTAMPVPRVKVGPDGQLIVDEKSLIIERTEQKNRSGPIVHDETNGGGFYKRRQKSKDWSKWDTLRFYKALSNIGTDFLLMQKFFPKRTRQELKLKFKKEERTNRKLIEQALKCQIFDMESLKEEMEILAENEKKELEALKMKTEVAKKQHKYKRLSKCRFVIGSIEEIVNSCEEDIDDDLSSGESKKDDSPKKLRKSTRRKRKTTISSMLENDDESSSDAEETEVYNVKPTRSGRLPKRRKLQAPNVKGSDSSESEEPLAQESELPASTEPEKVTSQTQDILANIIPNMKDVEPGSLVILTRESPGEPGKTVVQVYMVSKNYDANDPNSDQNMTPVNLSPELLATVNSKISEAEPVHVNSKITANDSVHSKVCAAESANFEKSAADVNSVISEGFSKNEIKPNVTNTIE